VVSEKPGDRSRNAPLREHPALCDNNY